MQRPQRILFVCLGNTCRSPMAEGVFRRRLAERALEHDITASSAGTRARTAGGPPDPRACAAMQARGIDISHLRSRQVRASDLAAADLIIAVDEACRSDLSRQFLVEAGRPVYLLLDFAPEIGLAEVPDPFAGTAVDYEHALDFITSGCAGLLRHLTPI